MGREIERKFLLRDASWRAAVESQERLRQAYLGGERCSVRVRIGGERAWLNIKSRELGVSRDEFEYPIPRADAELMIERYGGEQVDKVRHIVRHGAHRWEIDEFLGDNAGLVVAELELAAADEVYARPSWLGAEVTDEPRYFNTSLAREPFARWPDRDALRARE